MQRRLAYWQTKSARHYFVDPLEANGRRVYCLVPAESGGFTMHECVNEAPVREVENLTRFQFGLAHGDRKLERTLNDWLIAHNAIIN